MYDVITYYVRRGNTFFVRRVNKYFAPSHETPVYYRPNDWLEINLTPVKNKHTDPAPPELERLHKLYQEKDQGATKQLKKEYERRGLDFEVSQGANAHITEKSFQANRHCANRVFEAYFKYKEKHPEILDCEPKDFAVFLERSFDAIGLDIPDANTYFRKQDEERERALEADLLSWTSRIFTC